MGTNNKPAQLHWPGYKFGKKYKTYIPRLQKLSKNILVTKMHIVVKYKMRYAIRVILEHVGVEGDVNLKILSISVNVLVR